jgi:hypothetical protein
MIIIEQVTLFSDNSHILGYPILIQEEAHGYINAPREKVPEIIEKTKGLDIEIHVIYEKEVTE